MSLDLSSAVVLHLFIETDSYLDGSTRTYDITLLSIIIRKRSIMRGTPSSAKSTVKAPETSKESETYLESNSKDLFQHSGIVKQMSADRRQEITERIDEYTTIKSLRLCYKENTPRKNIVAHLTEMRCFVILVKIKAGHTVGAYVEKKGSGKLQISKAFLFLLNQKNQNQNQNQKVKFFKKKEPSIILTFKDEEGGYISLGLADFKLYYGTKHFSSAVGPATKNFNFEGTTKQDFLGDKNNAKVKIQGFEIHEVLFYSEQQLKVRQNDIKAQCDLSKSKIQAAEQQNSINIGYPKIEEDKPTALLSKSLTDLNYMNSASFVVQTEHGRQESLLSSGSGITTSFIKQEFQEPTFTKGQQSFVKQMTPTSSPAKSVTQSCSPSPAIRNLSQISPIPEQRPIKASPAIDKADELTSQINYEDLQLKTVIICKGKQCDPIEIIQSLWVKVSALQRQNKDLSARLRAKQQQLEKALAFTPQPANQPQTIMLKVDDEETVAVGSQNADLKRQLAKYKQSMEESVEQARKIQERLKQKEREIVRKSNQIDKISLTVNQQQALISQKDEEISKISKEFTDSQSTIKKLKDEVQEKTNKIASSNIQINMMREINSQKEKELDKYKTEAERLGEQVRQKEKQIIDKNDEIAQKEQEIQAKESELIELRSRISQIQDLLSNAQILIESRKQFVSPINLFFQGNLLSNELPMKERLAQNIRLFEKRRIESTTLLYSYDKNTAANIHSYIDGRPNVLCIVRTKFVILAAYYQGEIAQRDTGQQGLLLTSLNENDVYTAKKNNKYRAMEYNLNTVTYGNGDLRIYCKENKLTGIFGTGNTYFDSRNKKFSQLVQEEGEVNDIYYEFYQLFFSSSEEEMPYITNEVSESCYRSR